MAGANEVIGQRSDLEYSGAGNAAMADVAFYSYALTPSQIQRHYLNQAALTLTQVSGQSTLTWPVGNLLGSTNVSGPWVPITGATSPYPIPLTNSQFFYVVGAPK